MLNYFSLDCSVAFSHAQYFTPILCRAKQEVEFMYVRVAFKEILIHGPKMSEMLETQIYGFIREEKNMLFFLFQKIFFNISKFMKCPKNLGLNIYVKIPRSN